MNRRSYDFGLKISTLVGLVVLLTPLLSIAQKESAMTEQSTLKPSDLLLMRSQLEEQWANDYLSEQPPEASQLDFIIGSWDMTRRAFDLAGNVTAESKGEMHAQKLLEDRIIQEIYYSYLPDGRRFRGGIGLHSYIPSTKQWVTASLDAAVGVNSAVHIKDGDEFVYESSFEIQGVPIRLRGRWYAINEDSYFWEGSGSLDGETWFKTYEVHMIRKPS